jgi:2-methylaconitate cis-trans-isomerase PrpF
MGAPVKLEFRDPGGATTGRLLPTGNVADTLEVPGVGKLRVSMVDAANAAVFVKAADLGLTGTEMPDEIEASLQEELDWEARHEQMRADSLARGTPK